MIETFSGLPRKSSAIFGNLRTSSGIFGNSPKMFGNVRLAFGTILGNLCKSSESGRKSSENHKKRRHQYAYIIKRTLHVSSKIWILCSRGKDNISLVRCARSLRSLVRYCSCHLNIKFISSRYRVISSIYYYSVEYDRITLIRHGKLNRIIITNYTTTTPTLC